MQDFVGQPVALFAFQHGCLFFGDDRVVRLMWSSAEISTGCTARSATVSGVQSAFARASGRRDWIQRASCVA
jgi:hypothetical protein